MIPYHGNEATVAFANWWLETIDAETLLEEALDDNGWPDPQDPEDMDFAAAVERIAAIMQSNLDAISNCLLTELGKLTDDLFAAALLGAAVREIDCEQAAAIVLAEHARRRDEECQALNEALQRRCTLAPSVN